MSTDDNFNIFTESDTDHVAYGLCVLGTTAVGATFGSMAGGQTFLGAAGGAVFGLFTCKLVRKAIKQKLFSSTRTMTPFEFSQLVQQTHHAYPKLNKRQVLDLIASARKSGSGIYASRNFA